MVYGETAYYSFSAPGDTLTNGTSLRIVADGSDDLVFPVSLGPFIVPSLTSSNAQTVNFTVAMPLESVAASQSDMAVRIVAPVAQPLTLGPALVAGTGTLDKDLDERDGFQIWTGTFDVGQRSTGAVSLTLLQGDVVMDTLLLGGGVGGW